MRVNTKIDVDGNIGIPTAIIKRNLRIKSDSEQKGDELAEEAYNLNSKVLDDERVTELYRHICGTNDYKWNNYKRPTGEIYEFNEEKYFLFNFRNTLRMSSKNNTEFSFKFSCTASSFNSSKESDPKKLNQVIDGFYWSSSYAIKFNITSGSSHKKDFSWINPDLLAEIKIIKPQLDLSDKCNFLTIY